MLRWCLYPKFRIRSSHSILVPVVGFAPTEGAWSLLLVRSLRLVRFHICYCGFTSNLFQCTVLVIDDGCWSNMLSLWGFSTTIFRLSTTTNSTKTRFAWLWWRRGENGGMSSLGDPKMYLYILIHLELFILMTMIINRSAEFLQI
jgi:hypothetical protein